MKALGNLLLVLFLMYLGAAAWLYFNQRNILFLPDHHRKSNNGFYFTAKDGTKIWVSVYNKGKERALIYFPGNTENDWEYPERIAKNLPDHTIYFIHYRGYGQSEGKPSQNAFYSDALELFDLIAKKHKDIDIIGRSLGTAMAVYTSAKREAHRLVLVTPFAGIAMIAKDRYPWMPIDILLKDPFPSSYFAHSVSEKTLVILAEYDTTTPYKSSQKLINSLPKKPEVITLRGVNHSAVIRHPLYMKVLGDFLESKK